MKRIAVLLAVLFASLLAQASYLYWMVDSTYKMANTGAEYTYAETGAPFTFSSVRFVAKEDNSVLALSVGSVNDKGVFVPLSGMTTANGEFVPTAGRVVIDLGDNPANYSFYIEVYTSDNQLVGISDATSYSKLPSNALATMNGTQIVPALEAWHGGTMNAPEPTGGMLLLMGAAALGLRRRKKTGAA